MIVAVVPVKGLASAKSRLSPHLPGTERERLVLQMASRAVTAIRQAGMVQAVAVATPDAGMVAQLEAHHLPDAGSLNETLRASADWARVQGAAGMLILPCDLPLVSAADIVSMLTQGSGVTIAPTHDGGTGALYLAPPRCIVPEFGEASYARHVLAARERGVPVHEIEREGLRFDLDTAADLQRFGGVLRAG